MLTNKRRSWNWFLVGCLTVLQSACSPQAYSITPTPILYAPPVLAGPVKVEEGVVISEPKLGELILNNPGLGWQYGPESSPSLQMPETVAYANRREIAWSILNPEDGVYDWSALDQQLKAAQASSRQFSFRVYTMVGEGLDGAMVPDWVFAKGAALIPDSEEPDYSNCAYQDAWGRFVNELVQVYDGNPNIAFIDISGYGNFNEWSWQDIQTEWDEAWASGYLNGSASSGLFETLDGQARRRLADMFIGGSFDGHQCRATDGTVSTTAYSYAGFQKTQLLMPYAGIVQSSQYVFSRRSDVGFRYDCLGRSGPRILEKVGNLISKLWLTAPVVFEFCNPDEFDYDDAKTLLQTAHASMVHDNVWRYDEQHLKGLLEGVGYQYYLKSARLTPGAQMISLQLDWQNVGLAPNYPKMGQAFELYFYLVDATGKIIHQEVLPAVISQWLPREQPGSEPPTYQITQAIQLTEGLTPGTYYAAVSIVDTRTGLPIELAFGGRDPAGWHLVAPLEIK